VDKNTREYNIFGGVGCKGTAILLDGSGYHRVKLEQDRIHKILFLNINSGHHMNFKPWKIALNFISKVLHL
jgi:hypothetical protein